MPALDLFWTQFGLNLDLISTGDRKKTAVGFLRSELSTVISYKALFGRWSKASALSFQRRRTTATSVCHEIGTDGGARDVHEPNLNKVVIHLAGHGLEHDISDQNHGRLRTVSKRPCHLPGGLGVIQRNQVNGHPYSGRVRR